MLDVPTAWQPELAAGITLALAWLVGLLVRWIVRGFFARSNPLVSSSAQRAATTIVWIAGAVVAVQEVGVSVDVLLLVVGLLGVAAIVALRLPLENLGAKYFEDVYTPFKLGDTIQVGPTTGKVIEINAMATVLLTEDDHLVAVPNAALLRTATVNLSPQAWKELIVPISLPASADVAEFERHVLKGLSKLRGRLDPRYPPIFTTKARTSQATELVLTVMVRRAEDRDPVLSEVNLRLSDGLARRPSAPALSRPSSTETPPQLGTG